MSVVFVSLNCDSHFSSRWSKSINHHKVSAEFLPLFYNDLQLVDRIVASFGCKFGCCSMCYACFATEYTWIPWFLNLDSLMFKWNGSWDIISGAIYLFNGGSLIFKWIWFYETLKSL